MTRRLSRTLRLAALLLALAACDRPSASPARPQFYLPPPLSAPQVAEGAVSALDRAAIAESDHIHPHALLLAHNAERRKAGLPELRAVGPLMLAAQSHADEMARTGNFSHRGRDGSWPWDRVDKQGYKWSSAGENIALGYHTTTSIMDGWMRSSGHRANILGGYTEVGFGLTEGPRGLYAVVVFARPAR